MDLQKILSDLKTESDRIARAIAALAGIDAAAPRKIKQTGARQRARRRGSITPEGRRRLSLAMKKRWAERRKRGS